MSKPKLIIKLSRKDPESTLFDVHYISGVKLGEAAKEVDGFFYFWPDPLFSDPLVCDCGWPAHTLRAIADELDRLNEPWAKQVGAQSTITE